MYSTVAGNAGGGSFPGTVAKGVVNIGAGEGAIDLYGSIGEGGREAGILLPATAEAGHVVHEVNSKPAPFQNQIRKVRHPVKPSHCSICGPPASAISSHVPVPVSPGFPHCDGGSPFTTSAALLSSPTVRRNVFPSKCRTLSEV